MTTVDSDKVVCWGILAMKVAVLVYEWIVFKLAHDDIFLAHLTTKWSR
jgi:hypothetical protein